MKEKLTDLMEIVGAGILGEKFKEFIHQQIEVGDELHRTSERLGVTTDALQKLRLAGQLAGASTENVDIGLRFLNRSMGEAITSGGELSAEFKRLGVTQEMLRKGDITEVALQMADGLGKLKTHAERTAAAMKILGRGGAALTPMFEGGREDLEEAFKAFEDFGGGITEEFARDAKKAEDSMVLLKFGMQNLKTRVAAEFLPQILKTTRRMGEWVKKILDLTKHTNALKHAFALLIPAGSLALIWKIAKLFGVADTSAFGLVKTLLKFGPIVLLIAGLGLVFEDLWTMMEGGNSVIGKTLDQMFGVGAAAAYSEKLRDVWKQIKEVWTQTAPVVGQLGKQMLDLFIEALPYMVKGVLVLAHVLGGVVSLLGGFVQSIMAIPDAIKKGDFGAIGKIIDKAGDTAVDMWKNIPKDISMDFGKSATGAYSLPSGGVGGIGSMNVKIENNISGTSDPKIAAKLAGDSTRKAVGGADMRAAFAAVQP